jgi:hypothetical protein
MDSSDVYYSIKPDGNDDCLVFMRNNGPDCTCGAHNATVQCDRHLYNERLIDFLWHAAMSAEASVFATRYVSGMSSSNAALNILTY